MKKELKKGKVIRSKLAIFSFILSLVPIIMVFLYSFIIGIIGITNQVNIFYNSIYIYNLIIKILPIFPLFLSIISLILIKIKKLRGIGFAISGLIISFIELYILYLTPIKST